MIYIRKSPELFAEDLQFDLGDRKLVLEDLWINILPEGGYHSAHIHPHSVISGTTYVAMPDGASSLRLEDPRHAMMMAAPARIKDARREMQNFIYMAPEAGTALTPEMSASLNTVRTSIHLLPKVD